MSEMERFDQHRLTVSITAGPVPVSFRVCVPLPIEEFGLALLLGPKPTKIK